MPLYTLYPCRKDGTSETFVTFDLTDDEEAYGRALHVLDQHVTASHIAIWCGERKVTTRERVDSGPTSAVSKDSTSSAQSD